MDRLTSEISTLQVQELRPDAGTSQRILNRYCSIDEKLFGLTEKQKKLKDSIFHFLRTDPLFNGIKEDEDVPYDIYREIFKVLGKVGALGITVKKDYDGQGCSYFDLILVEEELSQGVGEIAFAYIGHTNRCVHPIHRFGTEEQKRKYLPKMCSGELHGSTIITNPIAVRPPQADYYIINTNGYTVGTIADIFIVYATTNVKQGKTTAFIVEKTYQGFIVNENDDILLRNCKVPAANVLGGLNNGSVVYKCFEDLETVMLASKKVGLMQTCCDVAFKCAQSTNQFDKYQYEIARMYTKLCAARSYLYTIARAYDCNHLTMIDIYFASLFCTKNAKHIAFNAKKIIEQIGSIKQLLRDGHLSQMDADFIEDKRKVINCLISHD